MNSAVRPSFEVVFVEKSIVSSMNSARNPLKNVRRNWKVLFGTIQTYTKPIKQINEVKSPLSNTYWKQNCREMVITRSQAKRRNKADKIYFNIEMCLYNKINDRYQHTLNIYLYIYIYIYNSLLMLHLLQ